MTNNVKYRNLCEIIGGKKTNSKFNKPEGTRAPDKKALKKKLPPCTPQLWQG